MDSSIDPAIELNSQYNRRIRNGEGGKNQVDRISHLPDELTADILSFLPTKEAIKTSVLSKRWRHVWNGITSIRLSGKDSDCDKFANLVDHVLRHCNPALCRRFYLSFSESTDLSRVNAWIRYALSLELEYLTLWVHDREYYYSPMPHGPSCVLACSTLTVLELKSTFAIEVPDEILCFPRLNSMELSAIYPDQADGVQQLLSRCPVLESFSLSVYLDDEPAPLTTIDICIPFLKRLTFRINGYDFFNSNKSSNYKVIINTPSLEYLKIVDDSFLCFEMKNVVRLCDVYLENLISGHMAPEKLLERFKGVTTSKRLTLFANTICTCAIAVSYPWEWPTFEYLDVLTVYPSLYMHNWTWLPKLLHTTSHLQVLILNLDCFNNHPYGLKWMPPDNTPLCLLKHLKIIGITSFRGIEGQLQVVEYLLNRSRVLDSMMIELHSYSSNRSLAEKLLRLPRASTTCDVQIFEDMRIDNDFTSSDYKSAFSGNRILATKSLMQSQTL